MPIYMETTTIDPKETIHRHDLETQNGICLRVITKKTRWTRAPGIFLRIKWLTDPDREVGPSEGKLLVLQRPCVMVHDVGDEWLQSVALSSYTLVCVMVEARWVGLERFC